MNMQVERSPDAMSLRTCDTPHQEACGLRAVFLRGFQGRMASRGIGMESNVGRNVVCSFRAQTRCAGRGSILRGDTDQPGPQLAEGNVDHPPGLDIGPGPLDLRSIALPGGSGIRLREERRELRTFVTRVGGHCTSSRIILGPIPCSDPYTPHTVRSHPGIRAHLSPKQTAILPSRRAGWRRPECAHDYAAVEGGVGVPTGSSGTTSRKIR
jgi:hypothetical protein